MSSVIQSFILCDGGLSKECHGNFGVDNCNMTITYHRQQMKVNGWKNIKGKDFCPVCIKLLTLKQQPNDND